MKKPYFIAEVGVNFYDTARVEGTTPLETAKKYVLKLKKVAQMQLNFNHIRLIQ